MELNELIKPLRELIERASDEILDIYEHSRQFKVQAKADNSPLTQADLLSNDILVEGLKKLNPDYPIVSEEMEKPPFAVRKTWQRSWLVDPLDGTREFVRHSGEFVVLIALIENHEPILGMIYAPVHQVGFYAIKGQGAFRWQNDEVTRVHTRPWSTDKTLILASRGAREERLRKYFGFLPSFDWQPGGSAIKFCRIAEGLADIYPRFGDTCEWDTAAGQILLQEAGGAVVDFNWQPLRYNAKESLLNPHFIAVGDQQLIETLRGEQAWQNNE